MKIYKDIFATIISPESLFAAWDTFKGGKRKKPDVQLFEWNLERDVFQLNRQLKNKTYKHGPYSGFYINDPKQRHIHKAIVRDRVLHHAIFSALNPIFESTFLSASFSCRVGYGTHRGIVALQRMLRATSKNGTQPCYALKCDIQKFFDSVDHAILLSIIGKRIKDRDALGLLRVILESYVCGTGTRERDENRAKGIPIGNLTSQLFANIYMNEFDQFVKHVLKVKQYVRYTDDFIIVSDSETYLEGLVPAISEFLANRLTLRLHPKKITFHQFHQGVDFLGYILFPKHRLVRAKTKQRIVRKLGLRVAEYQSGKISRHTFEQVLQSYLGVLSHANTFHLRQEILNNLWLFSDVIS